MPNGEILTVEQAKELLGLCRAGKLYEIEEWISSGKSLRVPQECRRTPLEVAIETGFHSLVVLLARHEATQSVKDRALLLSVEHKKLEFVSVLLGYGASIKSVPFSTVLLSWEPTLMRLFLEHGADAMTGYPFAEAFGQKVRTALRQFLLYKQAHPELEDALQEQANQAFRHFCNKGDLKWASLLVWAGADPRKKGPRLTNPMFLMDIRAG